jgi:hypothetical protein
MILAIMVKGDLLGKLKARDIWILTPALTPPSSNEPSKWY